MIDVPQEGRLVPNLCLQAELYHQSAAQRVPNPALDLVTRLPVLVLLSSLTGALSARTGEQCALSLWTQREQRAAAFIMSCPDVMRPLYSHYAPHAPGDAAFVSNFPVSFSLLYYSNDCCIVCFLKCLNPGLLGQVRTTETSNKTRRIICTFTHLLIFFIFLVWYVDHTYFLLCRALYIKSTSERGLVVSHADMHIDGFGYYDIVWQRLSPIQPSPRLPLVSAVHRLETGT